MKLCSKHAHKRIAIGLGFLIGIALLVNGVLAWRAQNQLDAMLAELRAAGEPVSLADLTPKPILPDQNAAAYLERMVPQLDEFDKEYGRFYQTSLGEDWGKHEEKNEPPNPEQLVAMQKIVDAYPTILPTFQQAVACEQYASLADFSLWPSKYLTGVIKSCSQPRKLARYVALKMAALTAEGNPDAAIVLGVQMLQFARLYDHEPLLINYLVAHAIRWIMFRSISQVLYLHQVSFAARAELDAELALQDSPAPLQMALHTERAFSLRFVQEQSGVVLAALRWPMLNWMLGELEAENLGCDFVKQPLGLTHPQPDGKPYREPDQLQRALQQRLIGNALLASMGADLRGRAWSRCLRVLNALGEFKQRRGNEAENIEQLSLPHSAIVDPYTGRPLLLKKTDGGWIVYSVGANGVDDGGNFKDLADEGLAPPGNQQN